MMVVIIWPSATIIDMFHLTRVCLCLSIATLKLICLNECLTLLLYLSLNLTHSQIVLFHINKWYDSIVNPTHSSLRDYSFSPLWNMGDLWNCLHASVRASVNAFDASVGQLITCWGPQLSPLIFAYTWLI